MVMRQEASTGQFVPDENAAGTAATAPRPGMLKVKVWSPFKVYYDDEATSVSGVNATGTFDILPQHHNFITILKPCDLMLQTKDGEFKIKISGGIMRVHQNTVVVFLEV